MAAKEACTPVRAQVHAAVGGEGGLMGSGTAPSLENQENKLSAE